MTKLVESIAKSLVDHPEHVVVTEEHDRHGSVFAAKKLLLTIWEK